MAADDGEVTGWYGKLPSLGDFASRRLTPSFIEPWDDWLAGGLAAWREQSPDGWLDAYLASPSWRFVLMPGCLRGDPAVVGDKPAAWAGSNDKRAPWADRNDKPTAWAGTNDTDAGWAGTNDKHAGWAGVLMPSVDRVGRYFPLTLVRRLPVLPADAQQLDDLQRWLHRLDDLALDVLHDDWTVDQLEAELARLGHWAPAAPPTPAAPATPPALPGPAGMAEFDASAGIAALLAAAARHDLLNALHGHALWLSDDGTGTPVLRITEGLPQGARFPALLTRGDPPAGAHPFTDEVLHD